METKYFSLGSVEKNKIINVIRIVFGLICISVAVFWISFNTSLLKTDKTLWITILFLTSFGFYQIWAGIGRATRFIEIGTDYIKLKKNPVFSAISMGVQDLEKIELFPLNIIFYLKTGKRIMLRLGATFQDTNELLKDEIIVFSETNNIRFELMVEKM